MRRRDSVDVAGIVLTDLQSGKNLPVKVVEPTEDSLLPMIERLAALDNVDVTKLEKLLDVHERVLDRTARSLFDEAYSRMQPELPEIDEKGRIKKKDGSTQSTYAKYEDIKKAIAPILKQFGFAIRHKTEWPEGGKIRIVGILSHRDGHREQSTFEAPADKSDYRSDIQSQGSTVSYGRRYTTLDLLNITTRGQDNDGQQQAPEPPDGFEAFFAALEGKVEEGPDKLQQAFSSGSSAWKNYTVQHRKFDWDQMKSRAQKVAADRRAR